MKTKRPLVAKIPSLLLASFAVTLGAAAAQSTSFYSNAGSGSFAEAAAYLGVGSVTATGDLSSINYDSYSWDVRDGRVPDPANGIITAREPVNASVRQRHLSFDASGVPLTDGAGGAIESVTIFLYATAVAPAVPTDPFYVYDGINGTGSPIIPLSLTGADAGSFFSFTLTAAQFAAGFSIVAPDQPAPLTNALLNIGGENAAATNPAFVPGVLIQYAAVPEPSAALLGVVGAFGLLRRRRA